MMAEQEPLHVVIIGAGLCGLLLAQGLKKSGVSFSIYEIEGAAASQRQRQWGMSIQWGLPLLSKVLPPDLLDRLQEASVDPHYVFPDSGNSMPVYNISTGEHMKDIPLVKMIRVSRRRFRALLSEGIDIQYCKTFTSLRGSDEGKKMNVTFADGTTVSGDLVVGADGANSSVRRQIFIDGEGEIQHIPHEGLNMHVCYGDAEVACFIRKSLNPILAIGVHPKGYWLWLSVQDVPDPEKPEDWVFQLQWTWKIGSQTAELAQLDLGKLKAEAATNFSEPFKTAWTRIPDGTRVPGNRISIWPPSPVHDGVFKGKVALLGDAAHAMTFHRGQGLNHGIADAVELTGLLEQVAKGGKPLHTALSDYEAEMIKRAGEEVVISKMNTEMMHDWERLKSSPFMQRGGDKNK